MLNEQGPSPRLDSEDVRSQESLVYEQAKAEEAFALHRPGELLSSEEAERLPELYKNSVLVGKLRRQGRHGSSVILVSDIDRTFLLKDKPEKTSTAFEVLGENNIPVIFATGRNIEGVEGDENLPRADAVLSAVGTEIYIRQPNGELIKDEDFRSQLLGAGYNHTKVHRAITDLIVNLPGLAWQSGYEEPNWESRSENTRQEFKMTLLFEPSDSLDLENCILRLRDSLPDSVGLVVSTMYHRENCYYIDVLPSIGGVYGKALAIRYLKDKIPSRVIVAGDSGNDLSMMLESSSDAVLVGNALPEARDALQDLQYIRNRRNIHYRTEPSGSQYAVYLAPPEEEGPDAIIRALSRGDFNPGIGRFVAVSKYKQQEN